MYERFPISLRGEGRNVEWFEEVETRSEQRGAGRSGQTSVKRDKMQLTALEY